MEFQINYSANFIFFKTKRIRASDTMTLIPIFHASTQFKF